MASRDALLSAIIQEPEDDAPRLAYANLLEKSGDGNRAEFIRTQCTLDKLPPQAAHRPTLEAREQELLEQFGWDWAEEFGTRISQWVYRRGFIERVEMCLETTADEIRAVFAKAPIRHVRDLSQFFDFQGVVNALPQFEHLTGLEFWKLHRLENSLVSQFLASPYLRNLRTLILHHDSNGNLIDEQLLIDGLASPFRANVEELGVNTDSHWRGPSRGVLQAMAHSPYLRKLRKLNLTNAGDEGNQPEIDVATIRLLGQSHNLAGLEELDLGRTNFPLEAWDAVLAWPWLPRLNWLRLHDACQFNPPNYAELEKLPAYREAFDKRVANVDWRTEFISPLDGDTCWKGLTWRDRPRRLLYGMHRFVRAQDYAALELNYRQLCLKLAGEERTKRIDELPFDRYERELHKGVQQALARLPSTSGRCLFLRIRPDVEWQGEFHMQASDPKMTEPQEEFSYEGPVAAILAPRFPEAAITFAEQPLFKGTQPSGTALYVLARTVAAFGRCLRDYAPSVPIYFSCMYAVFWMKGQSSSDSDDQSPTSVRSFVVLNPSM